MSNRTTTSSAFSEQSVGAEPQVKSPWRLAMLFGFAAVASGVLLTGISAWFLGAVALAGIGPAALVFNFHTPAAFVRLFALGKTACKYGERVVGHRAALLDQVGRRTRLFTRMAQAASVRTLGWQLGNPDRLSDYMDDVEDIDYARLRVGVPAMTLTAASAALAGATAWQTPLALAPIALLAIAIWTTIRYVLPQVKAGWTTMKSSQRKAGQLLGAALASVVPLQAERRFAGILDLAGASFREAEVGRVAQRRQLALLELVTGLAGPLAALSTLLAAWYHGSRGGALLVPALIAFGWLALGKSVQSISRIVVGRIRELSAQESLAGWATTDAAVSSPPASPVSLSQMVLRNIPRRTPDDRFLGEAINLTLEAGRPTSLVADQRVRKDHIAEANRGMDRRRQQWPIHRRGDRHARIIPSQAIPS